LQVGVSWEGNTPTLQGDRDLTKERRVKAIMLAKLYRKAGYAEYSLRAATCATKLNFYAMESGERQLMFANFCHLRLCPMCTARRARRAAYKLSQVLDLVEQEHDAMFLFLTLTVRNVPGDELGDALSQLTGSWTKLIRHRQFARSVRGWFRAVEITRKGKGYHPHIHAILAVELSYFSPQSGQYIPHAEWVDHWQKALRVDYRPSVRIQTAKAKGQYSAGGKAAIEAAKYAVKDSDYISPKLKEAQALEIVTDYTEALRNRRLTAFGGWLKEAAKRLDAENLDDGDLIHVDKETIRADVAELIETYNWHFGAGDYVLTDRQINPLKVQRIEDEAGTESGGTPDK